MQLPFEYQPSRVVNKYFFCNLLLPHTGDTECLNVRCQMSYVKYHVSCVTYNFCCVACDPSPITIANSHSNRTFPCLLPHYAKQAGLQSPKHSKYFFLNTKNIETTQMKNVQSYANISNTLFDQNTPVHLEAGCLQWHTHIATQRQKLQGNLLYLGETKRLVHFRLSDHHGYVA